MRITCTSIDDFITNLKSGTIWENRVYYERSRRVLNGKTMRDATSFQVFYQTSAVLEVGGGQALLVCGVDCGIDRTTADGDLEGTIEQDFLHRKLEKYCSDNERGVRIALMPGVLDQ